MSAQDHETRIIRLELKYCERCGGLVLRVSGDAMAYCRSCAEALRRERLEEAALEDRCREKKERRQGRALAETAGVDVTTAAQETCPKKPVQSVRIEAAEQWRQA